MDFFFTIPPLNHLDLIKHTRYKKMFTLAHLMLPEVNKKYKEYINFIKQKQKEGYYILLDNGAAESSLVTESKLIELANIIQPNEIIARDVLYDSLLTKKYTEEFLKSYTSENVIIQGVVQGKTPGDYLDSYLYMLNNERIDVIGISKNSVVESFKHITNSLFVGVNRNFFIKMINDMGIINKPIHLLGMRDVSEMDAYKNIKNIRSVDSAFLILAGKNDKDIDFNAMIKNDNTPHSYFFEPLSDNEIKKSISNIKLFRSYYFD